MSPGFEFRSLRSLLTLGVSCLVGSGALSARADVAASVGAAVAVGDAGSGEAGTTTSAPEGNPEVDAGAGGGADGAPEAVVDASPVPVLLPAESVAPDAGPAATPGPPSNGGASAPSAVTPSKADASQQLGAVVVTGVRGSRPGSVASSPVPIDVIGSEELKNTGRTGLKEILGNIVPSLDMPALAGGGTSASVRPYSIRGVSGDYVLVLVNGKRRHTTALINNLALVSGGSTPVDLDLIATPAVGRIEVLRDGAAAQYGSDAISGVINLILDRESEGLTLTQTAGSTYEKGAPLIQETLSYGVPIGRDGFARFALEAKYHGAAKSSGVPEPSTTASGAPVYYYPPIAPGVPDPREAAVKNYIYAGGYGRSDRDIIVNGSYNTEIPVDNVVLYSFSTLSYRDIKDARGAFPANNLNSLPQIYPNGFQAYRRIWEWDWQPTLGVKTTLGTWDWDLSTSLGHDDVKLGAENTLNPSLGPTSPTSFYMGKQIQNLWVNNLDVSKPVDVGLADPLRVSLGLEQRWEQFQEIAGEPNSYQNGGYVIPTGTAPFNKAFGGQAPPPGLVSFAGTSPADAGSLSRQNVAGYVDLWTKITKIWGLGAAGRAEHYTDSAGNTLSGKVTTRVEILPGLALRGGINNGFRAPSLAQTQFSTTQHTGVVVGTQEVLTTSKFLPVNSPAAIALGATPLKPEKSFNYTAGVSFEPSNVFRATVDAYQMYIDDRIVKTDFLGTSNNGGAAIANLLAAHGIVGVDSAQFFTNAVNTTTTGVDAVAEYVLATENFGTFRPSAAFSYNTTQIDHVAANPAALGGLNVTLCGYQCRRSLVVSVPRDKLILNADWKVSRFHSHLRVTRFGSYVESGTSAVGDREFGAKWITDLELGYDLSEHFTLAVGANNLFDVYPDKHGIIDAYGDNQYGMYAPFGLSGGFYYARAEANF